MISYNGSDPRRLALAPFDHDQPELFQLSQGAPLCTPGDAFHHQHTIGQCEGFAAVLPVSVKYVERHSVGGGVAGFGEPLGITLIKINSLRRPAQNWD